MSEFMQLDSGLVVNLGLNMPDATERGLMAQSPVYPESRNLDNKDIERALKDNYYLRSRQRLAPWMINQNPLGKCNASAWKGAVEQVRANQGLPHVVLSDNDGYMQMNGGRDQGSALIRAFEIGQKRGISPLYLMVNGQKVKIPLDAYNSKHVSEAVRRQAAIEAARFRGWEWYRAPRNFDDFARCVASELARRNPVVFAWHVGPGSSRLNNGYVITGRGPGNHATYFHSAKYVGGKHIVHPDCKNSWGPSIDPDYGRVGPGWGDNGYALFTMEDAFSCNDNHDTYIVLGCRPDHQDQFATVN